VLLLQGGFELWASEFEMGNLGSWPRAGRLPAHRPNCSLMLERDAHLFINTNQSFVANVI